MDGENGARNANLYVDGENGARNANPTSIRYNRPPPQPPPQKPKQDQSKDTTKKSFIHLMIHHQSQKPVKIRITITKRSLMKRADKRQNPINDYVSPRSFILATNTAGRKILCVECKRETKPPSLKTLRRVWRRGLRFILSLCSSLSLRSEAHLHNVMNVLCFI